MVQPTYFIAKGNLTFIFYFSQIIDWPLSIIGHKAQKKINPLWESESLVG